MSGKRAKRVVVAALDASPPSLAALEAAADLAALLGAELRGMFVEDADLLRSADLPFARTVTIYGESRPWDREEIQRHIERQAGIARRAIERISAGKRVTWSFSVVRGRVPAELLAAAAGADVVTIGRGGWSFRGRARLGSITRLLVEGSTASILLVEEGHRFGHPLAVLYDGSPESLRALTLAASIVHHIGGDLVILRTPSSAESDQPQSPNLAGSCVHHLTGATALEVCGALRTRRAKGIVIPLSTAFDADEMARLLEILHCPALLVR